MKTLSELKKLGFEGTDASLRESLDQYGLAWATNPAEPDDWHFIFKQANGRFVWGFYFKKNLDIKKEFNWIDNWESFLSWQGMDFERWNALPVVWKISDLIGYYGRQNIMGEACQEGWEIDWDN